MSVILNLHFLMVPLILAVGGLALIAAIVALVMRRGVADADTPSSALALTMRIFRILTWVTAGLGALQAIFGALLYLSGDRPGDQLHFVYGGLVLLTIPVAYVYSDQKRVRRDVIIMLIALIIFIGAAVRALMTGAAH